MKRQRARLTRVEREVMRLQTEGREFSADTMRKARVHAGEDMDWDIEQQVRRAEWRERFGKDGGDG